jgi:hypothetical protein
MFVVELRVADNYVRIPFEAKYNVLPTHFLYFELFTVSYYSFIYTSFTTSCNLA